MRKTFHLGFDYYPEQWPEARWADDLRLMRACGTTCVRVAEFAWSRMEPEEGRFQFGWLDRFYALAAEHGIAVLLGTPTAAPPPWAVQRHPEIVAVEEDGGRAATTGRRYTCPTSPVYLRLCDAVVAQMAQRYGTHPSTLGWQTDNEWDGQVCFCPHCRQACREWMKERHGTVEALNGNLGLVFWAHEVTDWEHFVAPRKGLERAHPSLRLEIHRFFSRAWSRFAQRQADVIRAHSPGRWVTHNLPGVEVELDLFELAAAHDFLSIDLYPRAMLDDHHGVAFANDVTRSAQNGPHWVLELQTGAPCTRFYKAPLPREGQLRLWAHQCAAHGAGGVVFFRWRKSPAGQEMFGNGLLDHDARPRRGYREVQELGRDFASLGRTLPALSARPEVALVLDFADRMNARIHAFAMDVDFFPHLRRWYRAVRRLGLGVRFVRPTDDLAPFPLVIAPNQFTTSPEIAENFTRYVRGGGTLVGAMRMGWFDPHGKPAGGTLPGGMTDLFGVEVEEYERVMAPNPNRLVFREAGVPPAACRQGVYVLHELGAKALAKYERDDYAGKTAVSRHALGDGHAVYVGTMLDQPALDALVSRLAAQAGLDAPAADWPEDVELVRLSGADGRPVWSVLNHARERRRVALPRPMADLLTGASTRRLDLPPLTAAWLRG